MLSWPGPNMLNLIWSKQICCDSTGFFSCSLAKYNLTVLSRFLHACCLHAASIKITALRCTGATRLLEIHLYMHACCYLTAYKQTGCLISQQTPISTENPCVKSEAVTCLLFSARLCRQKIVNGVIFKDGPSAFCYWYYDSSIPSNRCFNCVLTYVQ